MFCSSCGAELQPNNKFCPKCGQPNAAYEGTAKSVSPQNAAKPATVQGERKNASLNTAGAAQQETARTTVQTSAVSTPKNTAVSAPKSAVLSKTTEPSSNKGINVSMIVGVVGALLALLSLFLPFMKDSYLSVNLFDWMKAEYPSDGYTFYIIPIIGSVLIIVFHLIKHPKLSIIGILALMITFGVTFILYDADGYKRQGVSIGFGVWFLLVAIIICIVAAFMKKRPK